MRPKWNGEGDIVRETARSDGDAAWLDVLADSSMRTILRALPGATLLDVACILAGWWASRQHLAVPRLAVLDEEVAMRVCGFRMKGGRTWLDPSATVEAALPAGSTLRLYVDGRHWATARMRGYVDDNGMDGKVEAVGEKYDIAIPEFTMPPWHPSPAGIAVLERQTIGAREFLPLLRSPPRGRRARQPGRPSPGRARND